MDAVLRHFLDISAVAEDKIMTRRKLTHAIFYSLDHLGVFGQSRDCLLVVLLGQLQGLGWNHHFQVWPLAFSELGTYKVLPQGEAPDSAGVQRKATGVGTRE